MKPLQKWIEVTGHFDHENDGEFVYDCDLPEDGQEILVTLIGGAIGRDICYIDKMGYHLASGWDWEDVFKWAPMPPAWWEENVHSRKGVFIPDITVEMFRNAPLEGVEDFMTSGVMEDIVLPSAQPETHNKRTETHGVCLDTISRQAAIEALQEHRALYCDNTPDTFSKLSYAEKSRVDELDAAIATLVNLPSAQPERKQGEWIVWGGMDIPENHGRHICSLCGEFAPVRCEKPLIKEYLSDFCPNCGADMRGGESE